MIIAIIAGFFGILSLIILMQVVFRPLWMLRRSGFTLTLAEFYQLQASGLPMFKLLYLASEFRKEQVEVSWEDIAWFHRSAGMEISNRQEFSQKTTPELLADVLQAITLVKSEGYIMSFQQAVMQILKGKNSREVAADFIHLMWQAEGRSR